MYYIQTQDGDLPYLYRPYKTFKGACKGAKTFMETNDQEGMITVCDAFHTGHVNFFRDHGATGFVEERIDTDTYEVSETIYH